MDVSIKAVIEGFDSAKQKLNDLAGGLEKIGDESKDASGFLKGMDTAATALAVGGIAALGYAATKAFEKFKEGFEYVKDVGAQLEHLSQQTGISAEKLSGLKLAAEVSGSSVDGLAQGLSRFNRAVDDASKGSGAAAVAFERLGIALKDSNGNTKDTNTLFREVVNRLAAVEDGAAKTALAAQLFGRSFPVELINQGADGLARLEREAKQAGITMSNETAKAANELNANLDVLAAYGKGFWVQTASPIVEGLAKITRAMRDARNEGEGFIGTVLRGMQEAAIQVFQPTLSGTLADLQKTRKQISFLQSIGRTGPETDYARLRQREAELEAQRNQLVDVQVAVASFGLPKDILSDKPGRSDKVGKVGKADKSLLVTPEQAERLNYLREAAELQASIKVTEDLTKQQEKNRQQAVRDEVADIKFLEGLKKDAATADQKNLEDTAKIVARNGAAELDLIRNTTYFTRQDKIDALQALADKYKAMETAGEKAYIGIKKELDTTIAEGDMFGRKMHIVFDNVGFDMAGAFNKVRDGMTSAIYGFLTGTKSMGDSIKGMFQGVVDAILQQVARLAADKILMGFLQFTGLGEVLGIKGGGSGTSGAVTSGVTSGITSTAITSGAKAAFGAITGAGAFETGALTSVEGLSASVAAEAGILETAGAFLGPAGLVVAGLSILGAFGGGGKAKQGEGYLWIAPDGNVLVGQDNVPGGGITGAQAEQLDAILNDPKKINRAKLDPYIGRRFPDVPTMWQTVASAASYASGTDMIVTKPTVFLAGETGSERVTVSPLAGGTGRAGSGSVVFNGPVMFDEYTFRRFKRMLNG